MPTNTPPPGPPSLSVSSGYHQRSGNLLNHISFFTLSEDCGACRARLTDRMGPNLTSISCMVIGPSSPSLFPPSFFFLLPLSLSLSLLARNDAYARLHTRHGSDVRLRYVTQQVCPSSRSFGWASARWRAARSRHARCGACSCMTCGAFRPNPSSRSIAPGYPFYWVIKN